MSGEFVTGLNEVYFVVILFLVGGLEQSERKRARENGSVKAFWIEL